MKFEMPPGHLKRILLAGVLYPIVMEFIRMGEGRFVEDLIPNFFQGLFIGFVVVVVTEPMYFEKAMKSWNSKRKKSK